MKIQLSKTDETGWLVGKYRCQQQIKIGFAGSRAVSEIERIGQSIQTSIAGESFGWHGNESSEYRNYTYNSRWERSDWQENIIQYLVSNE